MDLFSAIMDDARDFSLVRDYIPSFVSQEKNFSLIAVMSLGEVKMVVFSMNIVSTRGSDDLHAIFFRNVGIF